MTKIRIAEDNQRGIPERPRSSVVPFVFWAWLAIVAYLGVSYYLHRW